MPLGFSSPIRTRTQGLTLFRECGFPQSVSIECDRFESEQIAPADSATHDVWFGNLGKTLPTTV
jgi:hypothetical protein